MHIGKEIKKKYRQGDIGDGVFVFGVSIYSTCSSVIFKCSLGASHGQLHLRACITPGKKSGIMKTLKHTKMAPDIMIL